MARKQSNETPPVSSDTLPEGFNPVGFSGPRTWWKPEPGLAIRGVIVGLEKRANGAGEFLVIKATAPCVGVRNVAEEGQDPDYETINVDLGEVICVDLRADFEPFRDLFATGDVYEIYAQAKEKRRLPNGNTFWRFVKGSRLLSKTPKRTDDIPF